MTKKRSGRVIQQLHGVFTVRVRVSVPYRGVKFEVLRELRRLFLQHCSKKART